MLFFSHEHCINDIIKKPYQQAVIMHSALTTYIVANDNTQLLQYSVGHCNSRIVVGAFAFLSHIISLNVATRSKPKMAQTYLCNTMTQYTFPNHDRLLVVYGCVSLVLLGHEISLLCPKE